MNHKRWLSVDIKSWLTFHFIGFDRRIFFPSACFLFKVVGKIIPSSIRWWKHSNILMHHFLMAGTEFLNQIFLATLLEFAESFEAV